jgi:hypothetical protein
VLSAVFPAGTPESATDFLGAGVTVSVMMLASLIFDIYDEQI